MAASVKQEDYRLELIDRHDTITGRASMLCDALSPAQLEWSPGTGWGVGQVFEHLVVSNQSYLAPIREALGKMGKTAGKAQSLTWTPSIMGNLLARSLANPRKLPAPKVYRPGPKPRPGVIEEFLETQLQIKELMVRAADIPWTKVRLGSPVSSLIRLNLGDAFTVGVVHQERHFGQIERIRGTPEYPPR
jgi:hypothetical protein